MHRTAGGQFLPGVARVRYTGGLRFLSSDRQALHLQTGPQNRIVYDTMPSYVPVEHRKGATQREESDHAVV